MYLPTPEIIPIPIQNLSPLPSIFCPSWTEIRLGKLIYAGVRELDSPTL